MYTKKLSILDIVECLSTAMDLVSPVMVNHQGRVGYIAQKVAEAINRPRPEQNQVLMAGWLHDCGVLSMEDRFMTLRFEGSMQTKALHVHAEAGYRLLRRFPPFAEVASFIHFHHLPWANGAGQEFDGEPVPLGSHLLHLADRIEILIDPQQCILQQAKAIIEKIHQASGPLFAPHLVEAFTSLAGKESFWLDILAMTPDTVWSEDPGFGHVRIDYDSLRDITEIFSHIIDFRSRFTATHSSGVAACAVLLARTLGMSEIDCTMMQIAGNFHDLGKLAVPREILEKPGGLTEAEFNLIKTHPYYTKNIMKKFKELDTIATWAAEHHERLDGKGYPYHHADVGLSLGSRIMAVADVFTAITEDRPYRLGMDSPQAIKVLRDMAAGRALDGDVVDTLTAHFDEINEVRVRTQAKTLLDYQEFNYSPS